MSIRALCSGGILVESFVDETSSLNPHNLSEQEFSPLSTSGNSFGFIEGTVWLKLTRKKSDIKPITITLWNPILESVELYELKNEQWRITETKGILHANSAGEPFPRVTIHGSNAFIKIRSQSMIFFRIETELTEESRPLFEIIFVSLFSGFILLVIIYNFLFYFQTRNTNILIYISFLIFMTIQILLMEGIMFMLPIAGLPFINYLAPLNGWLTITSFLLFAYNVLDIKDSSQLIKYAFLISLWALCFGGFLTIFAPLRYSIFYIQLLGLATIIITCFGAINGIIRGHQPAKWYLAGWAFFFGAAVCNLLRNIGVLEGSFLTSHAVVIGIMFDAVFFTASLLKYTRSIHLANSALTKEIIETSEQLNRVSNLAKEQIPKHLHSSAGSLNSANAQLNIPLTKRELEVLVEIINGYSYDQIAEKLFVSKNTVKSHVKKCYQKLGVSDRTSAIVEIEKLAAKI